MTQPNAAHEATSGDMAHAARGTRTCPMTLLARDRGAIVR
jgi:hypothetical protein